MPILRKGDRAVHFAHVPRTGGRAILQAASRSGWCVERSIDGNASEVRSHLFYDEIKIGVSDIPSFALVRDPIDRFISATKYDGRCNSQDELITFIDVHDLVPEVAERHFKPQHSFIAPHTVVYKYETQYEELIRALVVAGIIHWDVEVEQLNAGAVLYEVDKASLNQHLGKVRRWYIEDYRRFAYIGSKA